jgi:uncharacterized protein (TIGR02145 family)
MKFSNPMAILFSALVVVVCGCDSNTSSGPSDGVTLNAPWNSKVSYGSLLDTRDNQVYRTVKIGNQTWMAQNLNFARDSSACFNGDTLYCSPKGYGYGRLYQWISAMNIWITYSNQVWGNTGAPQGVCPNHWHLPESREWDTLIKSVGGISNARDALLSTQGWWGASYNSNGSDIFGFRMLPAGKKANDPAYGALSGSFRDQEYEADFWTSNESDATTASYWNFIGQVSIDGRDSVSHFLPRHSSKLKTYQFSVRCVAD